LYEKKYIKQTKTRIKTMVSFAKKRYRIDIANSLKSSKNGDRDRHVKHLVHNMPSLSNCF
jgi:hypothetical protein